MTELSSQQHLLLLEEQYPFALSPEFLELLDLTKREAEVLFWVIQDKTNSEIASTMGLGTRTVRKYLEHIYAKPEVQTRTGAVVYGLRYLGMLDESIATSV